jgi:hypothetical protein
LKKEGLDWSLTGGLALLCVAFILVAKWSASQAAFSISGADLQVREAIVSVAGAVKNPAEYRVPIGTSLITAIKKAKPFSNADIDAFPGVVERDIAVSIAEIQEITVRVEGAVLSPESVVLPVGSRICDLKSKIVLGAGADEAFLKRKKKLKNGQILVIPHKRLEEKSGV